MYNTERKHVLEAEEQDKDRKEKYKLNIERIGFFGYKNFKDGDLVRLRIMESQAKHKQYFPQRWCTWFKRQGKRCKGRVSF